MRSLVLTMMIVTVLTYVVLAKRCKITCGRVSKNESYGFDSMTFPLKIDVGACEIHFDGDCESAGTCPRTCEARSTEIQSFSNRFGPFTVETVKFCHLNRHRCSTVCERKPRYTYYFPGSKYQSRIDVGKCVGNCNDTGSLIGCVTTSNKSLAIYGPNGPIKVDVIDSCSCQSTACYRADHFESYSTSKGIKANSTSKSREEKLINVGKCIGQCAGVLLPSMCLPSPENCQLRLPRRKAFCVPTVGFEMRLVNIEGQERRVRGITECGCASG